MNSIKSLLAAALLGAAGACGAGVPVIRLLPLMPLAGQGGAATNFPQAADGPEQRRQSAGSFAAEAGAMAPLPSGVAALMPLSALTRYGALVAARPLPASAPVLLLMLGCLVYLGARGDQRGFSLRPARGLLARSSDAPARA